MPLEGVVIATLAGLLAGGRPATACPRLAQNSSTAAVTASEWARTRLRRKKIGTVAGVRGTPFIHLMYVVERRPPSILG